MCFDPISMAIMTMATTAMSAMGSIMQGKQAAALAEAQQAAYNQQAEAARKAASHEATLEFEKGRRAQAAGIVAVAGSGLSLEGSPTEALVENAKQNAMNIQTIHFNSKLQQNQLQMQGAIAKFKGEQAEQAGYIGAATNIFSGLSNLYKPQSSVKLGGSSFGSTGSVYAGMY